MAGVHRSGGAPAPRGARKTPSAMLSGEIPGPVVANVGCLRYVAPMIQWREIVVNPGGQTPLEAWLCAAEHDTSAEQCEYEIAQGRLGVSVGEGKVEVVTDAQGFTTAPVTREGPRGSTSKLRRWLVSHSDLHCRGYAHLREKRVWATRPWGAREGVCATDVEGTGRAEGDRCGSR